MQNGDPDCVGPLLRLGSVAVDGNYLCDIGPTGLVFAARSSLEPGTAILLRVPDVRPALEITGRVLWCRPDGNRHVVRAGFVRRLDPFRVRMIWQVYCIERYRESMREREGRDLTREQAAGEWISLYASGFRKIEDFPG